MSAANTLKIWGNPDSIDIQKILWAGDELHVSVRRQDPERGMARPSDGLRETDAVPVVDSRGLVLWESNTLLRYVFGKFGKMTNPNDCATGDQWVGWLGSNFLPQLRSLARGPVRLPYTPQRYNAPDACRRLSLELDRALGDAPYLSGKAFGMADVAAGCAVWHWVGLGGSCADRPHLKAWIDRLKTRQGFARHVSRQRPAADRRGAAGSGAA
jgi:glutathione S-transferase